MFKRCFSAFSLRSEKATSSTADVTSRVSGDHNSVVNIVVQGGSTVPLPMRSTVWTENPQDLGSLAALLRWNTRLAPLLGRDAEMAQLRAWAESEHPVSIQLIYAQGGQGKTRVAAEFADGLKGWRHGWIDLADFLLAESLTWQGCCLLLVDYPEHQPTHLERLAQALERASLQPGQRLRLLLVAREAQAIQTALQQRPCAAWLKPPLPLADLPDSSGHPLVQAALNRLSTLLNKAPLHLAPADVAQWRARHPLHHSPLLATALAIHLARQPELLAQPDRWLAGPELLARLVTHEIHRWEKTASGHGAPAGALTTIMAWATLSGSLTDQDINQILTTEYGWSSSDLRGIYAALRATCRRAGEHGWAPVEPDLLAAQFMDFWLADPARQGRDGADGALACALLNTKDSASFDVHLNRLHMLAYDQTVRLGLRLAQADSHRLERVMFTWAASQPSLLIALDTGLGRQSRWTGLALLAAQVSLTRMATFAPESSAESEAQHARELNKLAIRLSATGDRVGALAPAQEAVSIHRRLAQANPAAYEPVLAGSLNNLANRLSATGDKAGALAQAQESVSIRRRLAQANPAAYEPVLAGSLNNLANRLGATGDQAGALALAQEAVSIRRRLAQTNPAAYEPDLAGSLNNLANRLSKNGDQAGALALAQEAVSICRRLAQTNPAAYEADLASSLNNLANRLSENGDKAGALVLAQAAVGIHRRLAQANPAAYEPVMAGSLNNLANCSSATGDKAGALALAQESVTIRRRLAQANPAAYEPDLAVSLNNLANRLSENGGQAGALALAQEAVSIRRRLAQANPAAYEAALAVSLNNLANRLRENGDKAGALALTQEAVSIRRRLVQTNPAAYEPDLVVSLNNLANRLSENGDQAGALAQAEEAVSICRRLAQTNPAAYEPDLAMSLGTLMQCQAKAGHEPESLVAGTEALRLFTALAERLPQAFGDYQVMTQRYLDNLSVD